MLKRSLYSALGDTRCRSARDVIGAINADDASF